MTSAVRGEARREPGCDSSEIPPTGHDRAREQSRIQARELFARLHGGAPGDEADAQRVRQQLIEMHVPLVEYLARRFGGRGEAHDDLIQVGTVGLIKAVDRFDTERGVEFSTYATPTIVGEIKRHFRDKGWAIRIPRRLQELRTALGTARADLTQELGRAPTVREIAARLRVDEEDVLAAIESSNAYSAVSLESSPGDDTPTIADALGSEDSGIVGVENRESLRPLLGALPEREKRLLALRFFANMTQSQIAAELGISQMHVSRLLSRTLAELRERMFAEE